MAHSKCFLIILITLITSYSFAQNKISRKQFKIDSLKIVAPKLIRPQLRFDNRLSFLKGQKLNISGFDVGVLLKNKLRVTLGYYSQADEIKSLEKVINDTSYKSNYHLKYGAVNLEFIYKDTRFFSLGMPLEFGFGSNTLSYRNIYNPQLTDRQSGFVALACFGVSGTFKPIRWIGLKAAIGYRKILFNKIKHVTLDGPYTSVGLAIDFQEIIRDYRLFKLKKKYRKNSNSLENAVDLITD